MFIPARHTGIPHRYFKITAIAISAIIVAGFVPLYTLHLQIGCRASAALG